MFVGQSNRFISLVGDNTWFICFLTFNPATGKVRLRVRVNNAASDYIPPEKNYLPNFSLTNWTTDPKWTYNKGWPMWSHPFSPDPAISQNISAQQPISGWNGTLGEFHFWNCYTNLASEESFMNSMKAKWNIV